MEYIGILKLLCSFDKLCKCNSIQDKVVNVQERLTIIEKECKDIKDFSKTTLTSEIPILITALRDYCTQCNPLKTSAFNLAYEKTCVLINYDRSYINVLNKDEIEFCGCIGHWGRYIIMSESFADKQEVFKEIKHCFDINPYIAGNLFSNELNAVQRMQLDLLSSGMKYLNRPAEIRKILISEALLELKESIIEDIREKYAI